jgi:mannose-6-phosphate isomerase-like protein (cupin superfamily)
MSHIRLSDVPEVAIDAGRWQPLNQRLGITAFGVNGVVMDPGDDADIEHDESDCGHQEVYVVVAGRAAFRVGDEEFEAVPGDVVAVPDPTVTRDYRGLEPGTRIVCFGAAPGAEHPYGEWITEEAGAR